MFFPGVAILTTGHDVGLDGFAATHKRHDMVHGQLTGGIGPVAIGALARGAFALPPLGLAKLSGLCFFTRQLFRGHVVDEKIE